MDLYLSRSGEWRVSLLYSIYNGIRSAVCSLIIEEQRLN